MSKRYGGGSVEWYRDHGFLPDALVNSLVLLGTGFGDETIVSRAEMVEKFSLEKVHASPAAFDLDKLDWMNGEYIRMLSDSDLEKMLPRWLSQAGLAGDPPAADEGRKIAAVAPLVKTRIKRLEDAPDLVRGIFTEAEMDPATVDREFREPWVLEILIKAISSLREVEPWTRETIESALRAIQTELGVKPRKAFVPFYQAIMGSRIGAPIFDSMELIGRDACLDRLEKAKEKFG